MFVGRVENAYKLSAVGGWDGALNLIEGRSARSILFLILQHTIQANKCQNQWQGFLVCHCPQQIILPSKKEKTLTMQNMRRRIVQMFFLEHLRRAEGQMVWQITYKLSPFSVYFSQKVLWWHDCYMNDHLNCSWTKLKRAFCKRYGREPWQEQRVTKGLVNQQKGDSAQTNQQQEQIEEKDQKLWGDLVE